MLKYAQVDMLRNKMHPVIMISFVPSLCRKLTVDPSMVILSRGRQRLVKALGVGGGCDAMLRRYGRLLDGVESRDFDDKM